MKQLLIFCIFTIFLTFSVNPHNANVLQKEVEIVENVTETKIYIEVINHTNTDKEIFYKVNGSGFRKSCYRPIIKKVPANSKLALTTLIPLKDSIPEYTYVLRYDDSLESVTISMKVESWADLSLMIDRGETIIFTKNDCDKCEKLVAMLEANRIRHKVFNISENERYNSFFWNTISKMKHKDITISSIPIAIVKGELHEGLQLVSFIEMLKKQ